MNKPTSTVVSVAITFFLTLFFNTLVNFYSSDKGTIGISRSVSLDGRNLTVITIENHSMEFIDGIAVEIPAGVLTKSLFADTPITIVDVPASNVSATRIVKVGQVSPRLVTRIFIPLPQGPGVAQVRIANTEATGMAFRADDQLESPLKKALASAVVVALLYTIFTVVSTYLARRETREMRERQDELTKELRTVKERMDAVNNNIAKQRILLQARLSDYSKELNFWRNTIKQLVLTRGGSAESVDALIEKVTRSLGTHGTKAPAEGFDSIRIAAGWLAEAEKGRAVADEKPTTTSSRKESGN